MSNIVVRGITIPSIEECDRIPCGLMKYKDDWWLRTSGYGKAGVSYVYESGAVNKIGKHSGVIGVYVRPALIIEPTELPIGTKFWKYGLKWQIVECDYAFCCEDIGKHYFNDYRTENNGNDWDTSNLKEFIENWFEAAKKDEGEENEKQT